MRIALLTKETPPQTRAYAYQKKIIEYLSGRGHWVGVTCKECDVDYLKTFDFVLAFNYRFILRREQLESVKLGIANLHTGLLPYHRGSAPNVHAIIDRLPCGVTLHWMTEKLDAGNIIASRPVDIAPIDDAESLYWRLNDTAVKLFIDSWPELEKPLMYGTPPSGEPHQYLEHKPHKMDELKTVDDLESQFGKETAHRFVDILRARTFSGKESAYILSEDGRKVYVRVKLSYD